MGSELSCEMWGQKLIGRMEKCSNKSLVKLFLCIFYQHQHSVNDMWWVNIMKRDNDTHLAFSFFPNHWDNTNWNIFCVYFVGWNWYKILLSLPPGCVTEEEHGHRGDEDQGHVDISALLTQHSRWRGGCKYINSSFLFWLGLWTWRHGGDS